MVYVIVFGSLLLLLGLLCAVFYLLVKLPGRVTLSIVLVTVGGSYFAFKSYERAFQLSVVPDALAVTTVEYSEEEAWGFGPGGNEAGIRVYSLPEAVAKAISSQGLGFLNTMPANANQRERRWRGYYTDWKETPVSPQRIWEPQEAKGTLDVMDYICAYGFCIDVAQEYVDEANELVNAPGSYYAFGRIGMILVAPARKRVYYLYNG